MLISTARTNCYHNSYFLKTFCDLNLLPIPAIEACTLNTFINQLCELFFVYNYVAYFQLHFNFLYN